MNQNKFFLKQALLGLMATSTVLLANSNITFANPSKRPDSQTGGEPLVKAGKYFKTYRHYLNYTLKKNSQGEDSANAYYLRQLLETGTLFTDYLPLAGGTLTGGLEGTTASFSNGLNVGNTTNFAGYHFGIGASNGNGLMVYKAGASAYVLGILRDNTEGSIVNMYQADGSTVATRLSANGMSYFNGGNVGIGTNSPSSLLHLYAGSPELRIQPTSASARVNLQYSTTAGASFQYDVATAVTYIDNYYAATADGTVHGDLCFRTKTSGGSALSVAFTVKGYSGNIGIGTSNPTEKLSVNGNIRARKLIVNQAPWADYVFEDAYQLPSLDYVAKFIKQNKHLPEVPSAKEVEQNGISVGDTQALLLKKIEELTLYILQQQQQINEQNIKMEQMQKMIRQVSK